MSYFFSRRKGYVYTSSYDPEESAVITNSYKATIKSPPNDQNYQLHTVDEVDKTSKLKKTIKNLPSVKVRLFRRNSNVKKQAKNA